MSGAGSLKIDRSMFLTLTALLAGSSCSTNYHSVDTSGDGGQDDAAPADGSSSSGSGGSSGSSSGASSSGSGGASSSGSSSGGSSGGSGGGGSSSSSGGDAASCPTNCQTTPGLPTCCAGACPTAHDDGFGPFYDCNPPTSYGEGITSGYSAPLAEDACIAYTGDSSLCGAYTCGDSGTALVECSFSKTGTTSRNCTCWEYSGGFTGLFAEGTGSGQAYCVCPSVTSRTTDGGLPIWR